MSPTPRALAALLPWLCALGACSGSEPQERPRAETQGSGSVAPDARAPGDLIDEAAERGLDYVNVSGEPGKATILEANGVGVALLDLGGDGDLDVVFAQGLPSLGAVLEGPGADLEVFLNDGRGRFERAAGPGLSGWWTGLATGDLDGDGDADLVAGGYGALRVLLQDERGRLVPGADLMPAEPGARLEIGAEREAGRAPLWVTSLALLDADRDGHLDLYVGQYLDLDPLDPPRARLGEGVLSVPCEWKGYEVYCGPRGLPAQPDRMLRGRGDGSFEDRTSTWLAEQEPGYTLAVGVADLDGDGDSDLVVAADSSANLLWINDGSGRFRDHAYSAGIAFGADGAPEAGMGVAFGDVDRDGRLDLAITNFSDEPTQLYIAADVGFANHSFRTGLAHQSRRLLSWGVHLTDFDGDGWLELFTANGHVYPQADLPHTGTSYGQADSLWRLWPSMRVERVLPSGERSILAPATGTRGSAVGDLDGDGAPDLVLARIDGPAALGRNHHLASSRLAVRCLGPRRRGAGPHHTPADGTGTRVIVIAEDERGEYGLLGEVSTAAGYQSASTPWLHFGLGAAESYRALHVRWPSGRVDELPAAGSRRRIWIREGEGVVREEPLP